VRAAIRPMAPEARSPMPNKRPQFGLTKISLSAKNASILLPSSNQIAKPNHL
jgi:hypothetical protein